MIKEIDFSSFSLDCLTAYLDSKKWIISTKVKSNNFQIWHRPEKKFYDYEIVQPLDITVLGYKQRLYELLNTLSEFENRDISLITQEIEYYNYDILKVRLIGEDLKEGFINLQDGVLLFEKVKNLIISILHSTATKRSFYTSPIPVAFENYYNSLKFGQTEHGSYIVNVLAPHQSDIENHLEPIENDLTSNISENFDHTLRALNTALIKYKNKQKISFFQESVSNGVSANLCDSLIGMSGKNENYDIEISIKSRKTKVTSTHLFNSSSIQYMKIATDFLKGQNSIENYTVIGTVINLKQQPNENYGTVTIKFKHDGKIRSIKLRLENSDYLEAVKAHANKKTVSIKGDLYISGKNTDLLNFKKLIITDQITLDFL
ncbi:TPA: hypothetical protein PJH62_000900 [Acinetobacter nosocomialis]|uniref:hypothetical protein n=1 Tax=Acinetobacter calcoaceticus/baumannii complex TaxID=909768 RepID=UPI0002AEE055|nr:MULTISPECIES: hypothetical protein [Acinetobacter calcoaceticus/baumannii complex]ELW76886.1 hypothetical protein ACIN5021_1124 [Acinetobacter sp. OIFC021]EXE51366.1 hypothetical protein J576_1146 [Acinetobacter sp. 766875]MDE1666206.1 hypothetical protein [Acinetobacter nosocomialis]MDE9415387.1 hypothetical protein [Acinetobacter nosocomialis]HAI55868.1 hypothetical protein [Acinetobacter nosocomialis]